MPHINVSIITNGSTLFRSLNSGFVRPYHEATLYNAVLGQLIGSDTTSTRSGLLLSKCEAIDDNFEQWRLSLKKNLSFHNGRKASAKDLEFSILRHLLSKHESAEQTLWKKLVDASTVSGKGFISGSLPSIQKIDEFTLHVSFNTPVPNLKDWLTMSELSLVPVECLEDDYFSWKNFPVGAGPYKIARCESASGPIHLQLWENAYPTTTNPPKTISILSEERIDTDVLIGASPSMEVSQYVETILDIPFSIKGIFFNYENPLAQNAEFRRTVRNSIDRTQFAQHSQNRISSEAVISSIHTENMSKFLIQKATGRSDNLTIHVPFRANFFKREDFEILQKQLQSENINLVEKNSTEPIFSDPNVPFELLGIILDSSDPMVTFSVLQEGGFWIKKLIDPDPQYKKLFNEAIDAQKLGTENGLFKSKLNALVNHFTAKNYAIPIFEDKVTYYIKQDKVKTINPSRQLQSFMFHEVEVRE